MDNNVYDTFTYVWSVDENCLISISINLIVVEMRNSENAHIYLHTCIHIYTYAQGCMRTDINIIYHKRARLYRFI